MAPGRGSGQDHGYRYERDGTDRQVDVEHPPPGQVVDEEPAEQRTDDARDPEDGTERALVPAPLARRDDVADDRLCQHYQAAAADPLDSAERDQLNHAARQPRQRRADQEDDDRGDEQVLSAVLVAELAPDRGGRRAREYVGGDYPGEVGQAAQVADDGRQGGGHDRLIQRGQQHRHHQRGVNDQQPALSRGLLSLHSLAGHADVSIQLRRATNA